MVYLQSSSATLTMRVMFVATDKYDSVAYTGG